jgi:hypothetical protein
MNADEHEDEELEDEELEDEELEDEEPGAHIPESALDELAEIFAQVRLRRLAREREERG